MEEHNVTVVVEFAIALMSVLDQINRESFQRFRLRIGLNHGPVTNLINRWIELIYLFILITIRSSNSWCNRSTKTTIWYLEQHSQCGFTDGFVWCYGTYAGKYIWASCVNVLIVSKYWCILFNHSKIFIENFPSWFYLHC